MDNKIMLQPGGDWEAWDIEVLIVLMEHDNKTKLYETAFKPGNGTLAEKLRAFTVHLWLVVPL